MVYALFWAQNGTHYLREFLQWLLDGSCHWPVRCHEMFAISSYGNVSFITLIIQQPEKETKSTSATAGLAAATQLSDGKNEHKFKLARFWKVQMQPLLFLHYFGPSLSFKSPLFWEKKTKLTNECLCCCGRLAHGTRRNEWTAVEECEELDMFCLNDKLCPHRLSWQQNKQAQTLLFSSSSTQ